MLLSRSVQVRVPPALKVAKVVPEPPKPKDSLCVCKRQLSSEEAARSCKEMGGDKLLIELNIGRPSDKQLVLKNGIKEAISFFIEHNLDFGIASSFFRLIQGRMFPSGQLEHYFNVSALQLLGAQREPGEAAVSARQFLNFQRAPGGGRILEDDFGQDVILDPYEVKPRRIWDLYSNRVIPFRWFELVPASEYAGKAEPAPPPHAEPASSFFRDFINRRVRVAENMCRAAMHCVEDGIAKVNSGEGADSEFYINSAKLMFSAGYSGACFKPTKLALRCETEPDFWAISHSWVGEPDRQHISSPVNQYEWDIPMPKGVTLEGIRLDLISCGAEYCWLDILCLRQRGSDAYNNSLATEEHRIDVPTIGNVYQKSIRVLYYFNGLGKPLKSGEEVLQDERHWLNRAWTLQEIVNPECGYAMESITGKVSWFLGFYLSSTELTYALLNSFVRHYNIAAKFYTSFLTTCTNSSSREA